jgi:hypothetical protein
MKLLTKNKHKLQARVSPPPFGFQKIKMADKIWCNLEQDHVTGNVSNYTNKSMQMETEQRRITQRENKSSHSL